MKKSKYKELEKLNREMSQPLCDILHKFQEMIDKAWLDDLEKRKLVAYLDICFRNRMKIQMLLEEEQKVKTKYKDQKLF